MSSTDQINTQASHLSPEGDAHAHDELKRLRASVAQCGLGQDVLVDGAKWIVTGATGNEHLAEIFDGVQALFATGKFVHDIEESIHGSQKPVDVDVGILPLDSEDFWKCDDVCADEEVTVDGDVAEQELGGENAAPEARPEAPEGVRTCSEHAQSRSSGSDHAEGFVIINREDLIEAIGHFLAVYIASDPKAAGMSPKALQEAMSIGLHEVQSRGLLKSMWGWGRFLYRASATGMALFQVYSNPWIVRGVLQVAWVCGKFLGK